MKKTKKNHDAESTRSLSSPTVGSRSLSRIVCIHFFVFAPTSNMPPRLRHHVYAAMRPHAPAAARTSPCARHHAPAAMRPPLRARHHAHTAARTLPRTRSHAHAATRTCRNFSINTPVLAPIKRGCIGLTTSPPTGERVSSSTRRTGHGMARVRGACEGV